MDATKDYTMKRLPACDIDALVRLEGYAPHLLTPQDRHALRLHRAAMATTSRVPAVLACLVLALVILSAWGFAA
jgi:hypothetical protein